MASFCDQRILGNGRGRVFLGGALPKRRTEIKRERGGSPQGGEAEKSKKAKRGFSNNQISIRGKSFWGGFSQNKAFQSLRFSLVTGFFSP